MILLLVLATFCPPGAAWDGTDWSIERSAYVNDFMDPTLPLGWDAIEDQRHQVLGYQVRLTTDDGVTLVDLPCLFWIELPDGTTEPCTPTYNSIADGWGYGCDGQWCATSVPIIRHVDPDAGSAIDAQVRAWNGADPRQFGGWSNNVKSCHAFLMR